MRKKNLLLASVWCFSLAGAYYIGTSGNRNSAEGVSSGDSSERAEHSGRHGRAGDDGSPTGTKPNTRSAAENAGKLTRLFGIYSKNGADLQKMADQALESPNPIVRRLAYTKLLEAMTPENAMEIRARLVEQGLKGRIWDDFNYAWGALAGREAMDFAMTGKGTDFGDVLSGWSAANPSEAIAFLDDLPESHAGKREFLEYKLITGLADADLALAKNEALRLAANARPATWGKEGQHAINLIDTVAFEVFRAEGRTAATIWAESLPDGVAKGAAMSRVARSFVEEDPEAAAAWAGQFSEGEYAAGLIAKVGGEWGKRNPEASVAWLETLPDGAGSSAGFREVMRSWEDSNPEAASKYLSAMHPSPERDSAVSGFAGAYASQDPEIAITWAQDISDQAMREEALAEAGRIYMRRDPAAAQEWLPDSGLPEETQQRLLNEKPSPGLIQTLFGGSH